MASTAPMHLVAQDYLGEGTRGNTRCGASVLLWTDEDDGKYPLAVWVPPSREEGNQLEDARMWGVSPKIAGRFIMEKCIHSWRGGVMAPVFTSRMLVLGTGGCFALCLCETECCSG